MQLVVCVTANFDVARPTIQKHRVAFVIYVLFMVCWTCMAGKSCHIGMKFCLPNCGHLVLAGAGYPFQRCASTWQPFDQQLYVSASKCQSTKSKRSQMKCLADLVCFTFSSRVFYLSPSKFGLALSRLPTLFCLQRSLECKILYFVRSPPIARKTGKLCPHRSPSQDTYSCCDGYCIFAVVSRPRM